MKARVQPPIALEIRFDGAATPARVAATARFVEEVLKGADPYLPDGSVTLVVSNYSTVAGIRAWDAPGMVDTNVVIYAMRKPKPDPEKKS